MENAEGGSDGGFDPVFELLFGGRTDGELVVGRRVGVQVDDGEGVGGARGQELGCGERSVFPGLGGLGGLGWAGWVGWSTGFGRVGRRGRGGFGFQRGFDGVGIQRGFDGFGV